MRDHMGEDRIKAAFDQISLILQDHQKVLEIHNDLLSQLIKSGKFEDLKNNLKRSERKIGDNHE